MGKDWVDLYIAWSAASASIADAAVTPHLWAALAIPSGLCTDNGAEGGGQKFSSVRALAFLLTLASVSNPGNRINVGSFEYNASFTERFGKSNVANSYGLRTPTSDEVLTMLNLFPAPLTSTYVQLTPRMWRMLIAFSLFVSMCIVGLGSEYLGMRLLAFDLSPKHMAILSCAWFYSQLLFPLLVAVSVYGGSVFGAVYAAIGMVRREAAARVSVLPVLPVSSSPCLQWKFGFPETLTSLVRSMVIRTDHGEPIRFMRALFCFLNGFGLVLHHMASAWYVATIITGFVAPTRWILAVCQPLIMQHWIVPIKYASIPLFGMLGIMLEIFWEAEIFGNLRYFTQRHEQITIWSMVIAHWCFFASGLGSFFYERACGSALATDHAKANAPPASPWATIARGVVSGVKFDAEVLEFAEASRAFFSPPAGTRHDCLGTTGQQTGNRKPALPRVRLSLTGARARPSSAIPKLGSRLLLVSPRASSVAPASPSPLGDPASSVRSEASSPRRFFDGRHERPARVVPLSSALDSEPL